MYQIRTSIGRLVEHFGDYHEIIISEIILAGRRSVAVTFFIFEGGKFVSILRRDGNMIMGPGVSLIVAEKYATMVQHYSIVAPSRNRTYLYVWETQAYSDVSVCSIYY